MNTFGKSIVIGMTVLGLAGSTFAVQAQDAATGVAPAAAAVKHEHHQRHAHNKADWAARKAAREQKLHDALKLTPAQEAAWASYSAATKREPRMERGERPNWKAMSAPERMEKRLAMARERVAKMEARLAATTTFYGTLTPEQKKVFDESSVRRGGGHRHHMKRAMAS